MDEPSVFFMVLKASIAFFSNKTVDRRDESLLYEFAGGSL